MDVPRPTLRALLSRHGLDLRLASDPADLPADALDREIRWVHSSDLLDPTPFLSEGLVLLTTGTQFADADSDADYDAYVERLRRRGVLGLGFGTEVVRDGIPAPLLRACRIHAIPVWEVPYRTPFIAVARANAEAVAAAAYARRTWALDAQRAVAVAALGRRGTDAVIAELSRRLDAWVAVVDAGGRFLHEHPAGRLDADAAARVRVEAVGLTARRVAAGGSFTVGDTPVTLQTLGHGGGQGVLAVAASLDEQARSVVTTAAAIAGAAGERRADVDHGREVLAAGILAAIDRGDDSLARAVADAAGIHLPHPPVAVAVAPHPSPHLMTALSRHPTLLVVRHESEAIILGPPNGAEVALAAVSEPVGMSVAHSWDEYGDALTRARIALTRGRTGLVRFEDSAQLGMLAALGHDDARQLAEATLEPLRAHDREHGTALMPTLIAWMGAECGHDAAARTLEVHRHTVRARIEQAQRLLGLDLTTVAGRSQAWAALTASGALNPAATT
ncbi:PucR family transcriptional regulator ligand-binding domain-containing protein [Demequina capsici]|uniref:PucR family transcriptional regulator ligand-binding domain-containing protein n=1 Tax=Demequina capsici TaxID=3075620 RepID=A0AA96FEH0_9MICO|nr:PucR family transcriptional regulator ligand-binding domain-containing protein [Demequina sp. PMTSA13]WNM28105.1 PucR family transcriptional regulator ligand-binding domain-containing protein [Demequina sp. PMTSA13]